MAAERWSTRELIQDAVDRFTGQLPGWEPPVAYGAALVPDGADECTFPVVNVGLHRLPALVLGVVTGRRSGTGTYVLSPAEMRRAVALLAPAEAATLYQHPNLLAWRAMLDRLDGGATGTIVAVFIRSLDDPVSSTYDAALRAQIARGDRSRLYT